MKRLSMLTLAIAMSWCVQATAVNTPVFKVIEVESTGSMADTRLDAVVEAVRQTTLSTQVAGAVVALHVKPGDRIKAGQEILRIDARAAQQGVLASSAQLEAAQSQMNVATRELERQKQLLQKQYISQAAYDRALAQWDAAKAQVKALQAQTQVAQTQSGFFVLNAPYSGVISDVPVTLGDMAMPGRPLITMHDPSALRVTAALPESLLSAAKAQVKEIRYELPGVEGASTAQRAQQVQILPGVDPVTHTGQIRLALPVGIEGIVPGRFARVWLPGASAGKAEVDTLYVPASAVVRRAEMTGVYVVNAEGKPRLRQVRLGQRLGERVEVLSGLRKGEKIAAEPQLAGAAR